jgi:hypothetical protein
MGDRAGDGVVELVHEALDELGCLDGVPITGTLDVALNCGADVNRVCQRPSMSRRL